LSFGVGFILYVLGSLAVAVCLVAVSGPPGAAPPAPDHGHGHGGH